MVKCELCKKKFKKIDKVHLQTHGITKLEYKTKFPSSKLFIPWNSGLNKKSDKRVLKNANNTKLNHWSKSKDSTKIKKIISDLKKGKSITEETKRKISKKTKGKKNPNYKNKWSVEQKLKASIKRKKLYLENPEIKEKIKKNHWNKNPELKKEIIEKLSLNMSKLLSSGKIKSINGFKNGWFKSLKMKQSFYYMSSYELCRMIFFESCTEVLSYTKKHNIYLSYKSRNGKTKKYIPDFIIKLKNGITILEEVKGYINDEEDFKIKCKVAIKYCKSNKMIFQLVFKDDLNKLLTNKKYYVKK